MSGNVNGAVFQASVKETLREHRARLRALEMAKMATGGAGLQFDTDPQDGDWLGWRTTAASGSPSGYGLHIQDASNVGILIEHIGPSSGVVLIESDNGDVTVSADSGILSVTSGGSGSAVFGTEGDAQAIFESHATGGTGVLIRNRNQGNMHLENEGNGDINIECDGNGSINLAIDGSGFLTITGLPTVNPGGTGRVWNNLGILSIT